MRKGSCNCLPRITRDPPPYSLCISNILLCLLVVKHTRILYRKQLHLVPQWLTSESTDPFENPKDLGPISPRNAPMNKQNLVRNFRDHRPQQVNVSQLSSLDKMERKGHRFNWPSFPPPSLPGLSVLFNRVRSFKRMHMEHWGREGTPAQSDKSAKIILTSNGVTDVD